MVEHELRILWQTWSMATLTCTLEIGLCGWGGNESSRIVFYLFQGGQEHWQFRFEILQEMRWNFNLIWFDRWNLELRIFIAWCPSSGTNLLLNGAHEFPPWADVRAEHADRGHEWMEKFSMDDIWRHHCIVPYVPRIFLVDWFRREMFDL